MKSKHAAIELSMTTIVVVVLSLTLLIMGFVLVRSVMCGAIDATKSVNVQVKDQINSLFGSTGGEVQCLGSAGDPITIVPGRDNVIRCIIKAPSTNTYYFSITPNSDFTPDKSILNDANDWITVQKSIQVGPGDTEAKPIITINLPKEAPEGNLALDIKVTKGASRDLVWSSRLSYTISRVGLVQSALC